MPRYRKVLGLLLRCNMTARWRNSRTRDTLAKHYEGGENRDYPKVQCATRRISDTARQQTTIATIGINDRIGATVDRAKNNNSVHLFGRKIMMMKTTAAVAALLGICSIAQAQSPAQTQAPGHFYFGAGLAHNTLEEEDAGIELEGNDIGFKIFGGYDFNQYFSAEIAYIDGGNVEDSVLGVTVSAEATAIQGSILGRLPVNEMFSIYGKLGLLAWDAETSLTNGIISDSLKDDGNDPSYGIGGAWKFGNSMLRLEYEMADIGETDMRLLSLNLAWSPGK